MSCSEQFHPLTGFLRWNVNRRTQSLPNKQYKTEGYPLEQRDREMASSAIPTMSVPAYSSLSLQPSSRLNPSISSTTIRTCYDSLADPPSYTPPFSRSLKLGGCGLTPPRNARTKGPFKPRSAARGTGSYQLRQFAEATLGSGSLRKAVRLPEGEDLNEWLAVNGGLSRADHCTGKRY